MTAATGARQVALLEIAKLGGQLRTTVLLVVCVAAPFALVGALAIQSSTPADTLFGRWVHVSGLAVPLVVLGFAGQWAFPALASVVSADVFGAEDHHGTWKLVLGRSRTRGEVFAGKAIVALGFSLLATGLVIASSLIAGLVAVGGQPLLNLSGSIVEPHHGLWLVAASGLSQLPPVLGLSAVSVVLSVVFRSRIIGLVGPVAIGMLAQLLALTDLPPAVRMLLPAGAFSAWRGLWLDQPLRTPIWTEVVVSAIAVAVCIGVAGAVFHRRDLVVR